MCDVCAMCWFGYVISLLFIFSCVVLCYSYSRCFFFFGTVFLNQFCCLLTFESFSLRQSRLSKVIVTLILCWMDIRAWWNGWMCRGFASMCNGRCTGCVDCLEATWEGQREHCCWGHKRVAVYCVCRFHTEKKLGRDSGFVWEIVGGVLGVCRNGRISHVSFVNLRKSFELWLWNISILWSNEVRSWHDETAYMWEKSPLHRISRWM